MIVLLVLGIVFLLYTVLQYLQHRQIRWVPLVLGLGLIVFNIWGLSSATSQHLFMNERTRSTTEKIKPVAEIGDYKFITTEAVGKQLRYTYRSGDKTYQTLAENTHMTVRRGNPASLKTAVTDYEPGNLFERFMLIGQKTKVDPKTNYELTLPQTWYVISNSQYNQLVKLADQKNETLTERVSDATKRKYREESEADPDFLKDKQAQKRVQNKIVDTETERNQKELDAEIQKRLTKWQVK